MAAKLYLETSVPSYMVARPSRDLLVVAHQQITRDWWEKNLSEFDVYISDVAIQEINAREGIESPVICTPEELGDETNVD